MSKKRVTELGKLRERLTNLSNDMMKAHEYDLAMRTMEIAQKLDQKINGIVAQRRQERKRGK